jgi:hypothetical protein
VEKSKHRITEREKRNGEIDRFVNGGWVEKERERRR